MPNSVSMSQLSDILDGTLIRPFTDGLGTSIQNWHIAACRLNQATKSGSLFLFGNTYTANAPGWSSTTFDGGDAFSIGGSIIGGSYTYWYGETAEEIIYSDVKSDSDINAIAQLLATKYGLSWTDI